MSRYLVDRITSLPNVEVVTGAQVSGVEGSNGILQAVRWRIGATEEEVRRPIRHLFLFIGAEPNTDWLAGSGVKLDAKRFVLTGADAGPLRHALETSRRGVFAIGDVRATSIKRVAAAVGEGAQVVAALHAYLADGPRATRLRRPTPAAPTQNRKSRNRARRCSRPASSRRGFGPPARRERAPRPAGARLTQDRCRGSRARRVLRFAQFQVRAARRRTNARLRPHRPDANASARRGPAKNRSRWMPRARHRPAARRGTSRGNARLPDAASVRAAG